jgi:hypothetical protein
MQEEDEKKKWLYNSNPDVGSSLGNIAGNSATG